LEFERIGLFGCEEPLVRGFGLVIYFLDLGTDADFLDQFDGRLEVVLEEPEFVLIEVIDGLHRLLGVIADIAQDLPDMGVVLLLDVGVVIFL
jgi:hypothetical protein